MALEDEAVDAALQAAPVAREGVVAEAEQALAVVGADGRREEVAEEGRAVMRVRVRVRVKRQLLAGALRRRWARGKWEAFEPEW